LESYCGRDRCQIALIQVHLIYAVFRRFRQTSQAGRNPETALQPERSIEYFFYIRVGIFVLWTLVMIASTLYQAFDQGTVSPVSDMMFACVGSMAFICFATQVSV
jgi:hypothetical protein